MKCFKCGKTGHIQENCWEGKGRPHKNSTRKEKPKSTHTFTDAKKKKIQEIKKDDKNDKELNLIAYQQLHPDAVEPSLGTPGSAGYDLTPCENGAIEPNELKTINTGLAIAIPPNCYGQIVIRSSAAMLGLVVIGGVIDPDYTGVVNLIVRNHSNGRLTYKASGKPIAQIIFIPIVHDRFHQVERLEPTSRTGGFGSTDKSIKAISNQPGKCVFNTTIRHQETQVLIDSGADGNFISQNEADSLKLHLTNLEKPYQVCLANGHKAQVNQQAKNLKFTIQDYQGSINLHVVPFNLNTIIFGNQWLAEINPVINWKTREFTIKKNGISYTIKPDFKKISAKEFAQILEHPQEDTHLFKVDFITDDDHEQEFYDQHRNQSTNPKLQELLTEYDDIFREKLPKAAPTKRTIVHHIPLTPGAKPLQMFQY